MLKIGVFEHQIRVQASKMRPDLGSHWGWCQQSTIGNNWDMTSEDLPHLELGYRIQLRENSTILPCFCWSWRMDSWAIPQESCFFFCVTHPWIIIHGLSDYQVCFLKRCNPEKLSLFFWSFYHQGDGWAPLPFGDKTTWRNSLNMSSRDGQAHVKRLSTTNNPQTLGNPLWF